MNVTYIHYHLKPGGVTTVIADQVNALKSAGGRAFVVTGKGNHSFYPAEAVNIDGLGYDDVDGEKLSPDKIANAIVSAIRHHFKEGCHLVHVHNPTLAKNKQFLKILELLKATGLRLFLQIHDFAEDGRAEAFFQPPYPADCHYGVINQRDFKLLLQAGLKKEGVHYLPNAVSPLMMDATPPSGSQRVVYPVRAIRRKNIGEAILLSLFFPDQLPLAITLPPNSEADQIAYHGWQSFVGENRLPVQFGVGLIHDFKKIISTAAFLITTSITEGFGFTFLEPWTADKLLWGRKLKEVCDGFQERGVILNHLYSAIRIPMDWIDRKAYLAVWRHAVEAASERFKWNPGHHDLSDAESRLLDQEIIDFGLLNEKFQKQIIRQLLTDPKKQIKIIDLNPVLSKIQAFKTDARLINRNKATVINEYGPQRYEQRLIDIYQKVCATPVTQSIRKEVLLSHFFNLETFSLLKWAAYED